MLLPVEKSDCHQDLYSEMEDIGYKLDDDGQILDCEGEVDEMNGNPEFIAGQWLQHRVRTRPDYDSFNKLTISIARAGKQMPKLQRILYHTSDMTGRHDCPCNFAFSFYALEKEWK
jgi:hypothetical protein